MNILFVRSVPICDFCSAEKVVARYHAKDFVVTTDGQVTHESVGDFTACPLCENLIDTGNWDGLLNQAVSTYFEQNPEMKNEIPVEAVRQFLSEMYGKMRQSDFHKIEGL